MLPLLLVYILEEIVLLVFIDESGCTGFKLSKGSTGCFVIAMVIFHDNRQAELASKAIESLRENLHVKPEFKFSKSHQAIKDKFFLMLKSFKFQVRALVVSKKNIRSEHLRMNAGSFYNFFIAQLMKHDNQALNEASVKLDGRGERRFTAELTTYLRKQLPKGKIKKLKLVDSQRNNLIQLADMVAGAIARSFHEHRKDSRWLNMLKKHGQINDIWEFG
tara:strand:+ start:914 stop:1570 length:657 start_codon:yes stop_codon:yes gene_type:complete